jgi:hypothetical protein
MVRRWARFAPASLLGVVVETVIVLVLVGLSLVIAAVIIWAG